MLEEKQIKPKTKKIIKVRKVRDLLSGEEVFETLNGKRVYVFLNGNWYTCMSNKPLDYNFIIENNK